MDTKWTPGPWKNAEGFNCFVETNDGRPLAVTHPNRIAGFTADDGVDCPSLDECLANGVLIAAAPELYEALEDLLVVLADRKYKDFKARLESHSRIARAALAKARGE